jgi:uncharacterized protein HemX
MSEPNREEDPTRKNVVAFRPRTEQAKSSPPSHDQPEDNAGRARGNVAALILAAILVAAGWLLVQKLGQSSKMQDCLMSGRTNCAPINTR